MQYQVKFDDVRINCNNLLNAKKLSKALGLNGVFFGATLVTPKEKTKESRQLTQRGFRNFDYVIPNPTPERVNIFKKCIELLETNGSSLRTGICGYVAGSNGISSLEYILMGYYVKSVNGSSCYIEPLGYFGPKRKQLCGMVIDSILNNPQSFTFVE